MILNMLCVIFIILNVAGVLEVLVANMTFPSSSFRGLGVLQVFQRLWPPIKINRPMIW